MLARYLSWPSRDLGCPLDIRGTSLRHAVFLFLDGRRAQEPVGSSLRGASHGTYDERLFTILVFGYRVKPEPGLVLFAPYAYASDTPVWSMGREIYGLPQQHAKVEIPSEEGAVMPAWFEVTAPAIKRFGREQISKDRTILRIERTEGRSVTWTPGETLDTDGLAAWLADTLDARAVQPFEDALCATGPQPRLGIAEVDAAFRDRLDAEAQGAAACPSLESTDLAEALTSGALRMLFLKQFRDIVHPDLACHQSIVEAGFAVEGASGRKAPGYRLSLEDVDSAPIRRELGVPDSTNGWVDVDVAFRVDLKRLAICRARTIANPFWNPAGESDAARLPTFIDRGGEAVWRHPSRLPGARICGFGLAVSEEFQQSLLDRYVNEVVARSPAATYGGMPETPFHLCACTGVTMAMLLFVEYGGVASAGADDAELGGTSYREFLAMQLGMSLDPEYPELDWLIPFIYLDSDAPRLGGREIYGYPKQLGDITIERYGNADHGPARMLELRTTAIVGGGSAYPRSRVVTITGPAKRPDTLRAYTSAQDMLWDLWDSSYPRGARDPRKPECVFPYQAGQGSPQSHPGVDVFNAVLLSNVGNIFLKQFRSAEDPREACYQAVCKTDTIPARFHRGERLDPSQYTVEIEDLASEPLLGYFKGASDGRRTHCLTPAFAYLLDIDLELTAGRIIANPFLSDRSRGTARYHLERRRGAHRD